MRKISFPLALGLASLGAFSGQKLLCQEVENTAEQRAAQEAEPRPGQSPRTQRRVASSKCCLTGCWLNDLGSKMWIGNVEADGSFSGEYQTAVSSTEKPIKLARLNGSQNKASTEQATFGFTVNWDSFSDSTTVFTGQCFMDEDKQESLQTMWLLREKAEFATDNWKATTVGTNVFTRVK